MFKKLLILVIKFMPIVQMVGMLFNNILFYFKDTIDFSNFLDYLLGNSVITTILLLICSYVFKFCKWHRLLIYGNFININIVTIDVLFHIPISDAELLVSYIIVDIIFILSAIYYKFKCKDKC